ncbi:MAG: N-acetylmuramoyl-L-alanine amidase [Oscillospiraceae bacterium]|nr:N-acetylmuramoyl-L-alanine amidase [Oscillospiraceae bacterium]
MNNRKNKALAAVCRTMLVILVAAFLILSVERRYKVENAVIKATEADIIQMYAESVDRADIVESTVGFYTENGLNTAIIKFNTGTDSIAETEGFNCVIRESDFLSQLKGSLEARHVQVYVLLDCTELTNEDVLSAIEYLKKETAFAGIVIKGLSTDSEIFPVAYETVRKGFIKPQFIFQTDNYESLRTIPASCKPDGVIIENMDVHQYIRLKNNGYREENVLLHYTSSSIESDIFALTNFDNLDGAVLATLLDDEISQDLLDCFIPDGNIPSFGYTAPQNFTVTYPEKDMSTYYDGIFVTGTGADNGVITINDTEYPAQYDGTFGVYLALETGDNELNIRRGSESRTITVTRKTYSYSGGGATSTPWDDSKKLNKGQVVVTTARLTDVLNDADDDSSIMAGLEKGTLLKVISSHETKRDGKKTYAYQLSNGGFVLAADVEVTEYITSDYKIAKKSKNSKNTTATSYTLMSQPVVSEIKYEALDTGDEVITFIVNNSPGVFTHQDDDALTLHFLDAVAENLALMPTEFFSEYYVVQQDNGVRLTMQFSGEKQLWGYDVSSEENAVKLYLKKAPELKTGDRPLSDVTIMLDAGHGGKDNGAIGVAGIASATEKDLNLAVAQATKYLLEEKGASVIMTRDDDTFFTLEERRNLSRTAKPDIFVAVHHNSMDYSYDSTKAYGSECYYFTRRSKKLAGYMSDNVSQFTGRRNRGAKKGYYYVTRTDIAPSVLMEYSFIINPADYSTTYSDIDIYRAAYGTVQAIVKAIQK